MTKRISAQGRSKDSYKSTLKASQPFLGSQACELGFREQQVGLWLNGGHPQIKDEKSKKSKGSFVVIC